MLFTKINFHPTSVFIFYIFSVSIKFDSAITYFQRYTVDVHFAIYLGIACGAAEVSYKNNLNISPKHKYI